MHQRTYKVILADAQFLICYALRELLGEMEFFTYTGEVKNEEELFTLLEIETADVVVIDYHQPGFFSVETIKRLRNVYPAINILVISSDDQKENIYEVIQSGVLRFLTKKCDAQEIREAFKAILKGEKFFCTRVFNYIFEKSFSPIQDKDPMPLSPRELEIVQLIARGLVAKEISRKLNLSTHTVYTHRKNIMEKLKFRRPSELILYASNKGLIID
jgi:DNA-binding NarL/FixJ family response regulator